MGAEWRLWEGAASQDPVGRGGASLVSVTPLS